MDQHGDLTIPVDLSFENGSTLTINNGMMSWACLVCDAEVPLKSPNAHTCKCGLRFCNVGCASKYHADHNDICESFVKQNPLKTTTSTKSNKKSKKAKIRPGHKLCPAVQLSHSSTKPVFTTLQYKTTATGGLEITLKPASFCDAPAPLISLGQTNIVMTKGNSRLVVLTILKDNAPQKYVNKTMVELMGRPGQAKLWFGPIFIIALSSVAPIEPVFISTKCFHHVVDCLRSHPENPCIPDFHYDRHYALQVREAVVIPAVKLNDPKTIKLFKDVTGKDIPAVELVQIAAPSSDEAKHVQHWPSAVAFAIGLKWYVRNAHLSQHQAEEHKATKDLSEHQHTFMSCLKQQLNILQDNRSRPVAAGGKIAHSPGSHIVYHAAGMDIEPRHIQALYVWYAERVASKETKEPTEADFVEFWEETHKNEGALTGPHDYQEDMDEELCFGDAAHENNASRLLVSLKVIRASGGKVHL